MGDVVSFVVGIGSSLLGAAIGRKKPSDPIRDSSPPTLTERGSYLTRVYGTQRVSPIVAGVFDRESKKIKSGGGGSGGGSQVTGYKYREAAWHQLCIGPAYALGSIRENGKLIFSDYVTKDDTPSGSTLQARDGSTFRIYWGELGQPVDNYLASQIGVRSHFSYCCYIVWQKKNLGTAAQWPQITYDIVCRVENTSLTESVAWLDESGVHRRDAGVNPAHAVWQVLTAPSPFGCGIAAYLLDLTAFEALGQLFESEHLPLNVSISDGMSASDFIAMLMQDYGFVMPQKRWLLSPKAIRPIDATDLPTLSNDAIERAPEQTEDLDPQQFTRRVYTFKNIKYNWRPDPIHIDDDGAARNFGRHKDAPAVPIYTVIDPRTASKIAQRRAREERTDRGSFTINAQRDAAVLTPGDAFIISGLGQLRVGSIQRDFISAKLTLKCDVDEFSGLPGSYEPEDDDGVTVGDVTPVPDVAVVAFQVPGQEKIVVGRVRGASNIVGADVHASPDGTTYLPTGQQDAYAAGGQLNSPMDDDPADIDYGNTISSYNDDILDVMDLLSDTTSWAAGVQLCVIDSEVMFLAGVEAVSGGYKLRGVKRGQFGTTIAAHATNAQVFIIARADLESQFSPIMVSGATIHVKTQPKTSNTALDLSLATAVTVTLA